MSSGKVMPRAQRRQHTACRQCVPTVPRLFTHLVPAWDEVDRSRDEIRAGCPSYPSSGVPGVLPGSGGRCERNGSALLFPHELRLVSQQWARESRLRMRRRRREGRRAAPPHLRGLHRRGDTEGETQGGPCAADHNSTYYIPRIALLLGVLLLLQSPGHMCLYYHWALLSLTSILLFLLIITIIIVIQILLQSAGHYYHVSFYYLWTWS